MSRMPFDLSFFRVSETCTNVTARRVSVNVKYFLGCRVRNFQEVSLARAPEMAQTRFDSWPKGPKSRL